MSEAMWRAMPLITVVIAGCSSPLKYSGDGLPQPPVAIAPSPSPTPTFAPTPLPTPVTTPFASATPSPAVTSDPEPVYPCHGETTVVSGTVYDEDGNPVDGATLEVDSLDAFIPYKATVTTSQGSWVVNSIPLGANVQITATKPGWTRRTRLGAYCTSANLKNIVDFGGSGVQQTPYPSSSLPAARPTASPTAIDHGGDAYFISNQPEIVAVQPTAGLPYNYQVTLSEPLDAANEAQLASSFRLFAAASTDPSSYSPPAASPLITVHFDATGLLATLSFAFPDSSGNEFAPYQLALVAPPQGVIQDAEGQRLGFGTSDGATAYPLPGALLHACFLVQSPALSLTPKIPQTAVTRWLATHQDVVSFTVPPLPGALTSRFETVTPIGAPQ